MSFQDIPIRVADDSFDKNEGQEALVEILAKPIGAFIAYKLYRRWGAPKWAAHGIVAITLALYELRDREAQDKRTKQAAEYVASLF
jgi:hypothetical protein